LTLICHVASAVARRIHVRKAARVAVELCKKYQHRDQRLPRRRADQIAKNNAPIRIAFTR
jgi:hypothetical protein